MEYICECEHEGHFGGVDSEPHEDLVVYHNFHVHCENVEVYETTRGDFYLCPFCATGCMITEIITKVE